MLDLAADQLGIEPGDTTDDGAFTLETVNCLGACALGPVVVLDGKYHDHMDQTKLRELLDEARKADARQSSTAVGQPSEVAADA